MKPNQRFVDLQALVEMAQADGLHPTVSPVPPDDFVAQVDGAVLVEMERLVAKAEIHLPQLIKQLPRK